jgi:hypothetical protein
MTTTAATPTERTRPMSRTGRVGTVAGLTFAGTLVAQNVLRGSINVANDASGATIMRDYADHRTVHWLLAALFVLGAFAIATFVSVLWTRTRTGAGAIAMRVGVFGTAAIMALFSMTVALDVGLTSYVHLDTPSPDVARGLWVLHNATFTVLTLAIAIALIGLAGAAVAGHLIGSAWRTAAGCGAALLAVSSLAAPAVTEGSPLFVLSAIGFVVWLAFIVRVSIALSKPESDSL